MQHEETDRDEFPVNGMVPDVDPASMREVMVEGRNATETILGMTAIETVKLTGGAAAVTYPPNAYWFDLDATNRDVFQVFEASGRLLIRPAKAGLYRIDFYTSLYAVKASSLIVWLYRYPDIKLAQYRISLAEKQQAQFSLTRYVRVTGSESLYVLMNQIDPNGDVRVWIGSNDQLEARAHSGLYVAKI